MPDRLENDSENNVLITTAIPLFIFKNYQTLQFTSTFLLKQINPAIVKAPSLDRYLYNLTIKLNDTSHFNHYGAHLPL